MPEYFYKAKKNPVSIIEGLIEAKDQYFAFEKIKQLGLVPLDIEVNFINKQKNKFDLVLKSIKKTDIVLFTRQFSDLAGSFVPVLTSLNVISKQTKNHNFKNIIKNIYNDVNDGNSVSSALSKYPKLFSSFYIHMIKAGELSGNMPEVLSNLSEYLEKQQEISEKIKTSMSYPLFIFFSGILTVFVLLTFVIPRIITIFEDFDKKLPFITSCVICVSSFLSKFWWAFPLIVYFTIFFLLKYGSKEKIMTRIDSLLLKFPVVSEFIKTVEMARFIRTLNVLVRSGIGINSALNASVLVIKNRIVQKSINKISSEVDSGLSFLSAIKNSEYFLDTAVNIISVSEKTGDLVKSLEKATNNLERQTDRMVKTFLTLLGPLMLILIVLIVGAVVIAMLLPILNMNILIE